MAEGTTNESGATKERKKPVFRFKYRLSKLETAVKDVCAEKGVDVADALKDKRVINAIVKEAMDNIRPEAIQERLEEDVNWLKARLKKAEG